MDNLWIYLQIGLHHVLDSKAYDHVLFIVALTVAYSFSDWKKLLFLVSVFTVGHTVSLLLSVLGVVNINPSTVEFLIPITIAITALYHLLTPLKKTSNNYIEGLITLFFGIIHGLGFSNYFKIILQDSPTGKLLPTLEFALGIEIAQLIVVISVLFLGYMVQHIFKFSKRDWILVTCSFVIGVVTPIIIENLQA